MRRTRVLGATALLAALVLVGTTPATAGVAMRASMTVDPGSVYLLPGDFFPDEVEERCGSAEFQAIVGGSASGEMRSGVYTGPFTLTDEHCTRLVNIRNDGLLSVAHIRLGEMTLTATEAEGTLEISYKAPGVIHGDVFVGPNVHTYNGPYTVTGGTGIFDGATGHGHIGGVGEFDGLEFDISQTLNGSLVVP